MVHRQSSCTSREYTTDILITSRPSDTQSIFFWRIMFSAVRHEIPLFYWVVFMTGHVVLMVLNLVWSVLSLLPHSMTR